MDSGWIVLYGLWLCVAGFALSLIVHLALRQHNALSILSSGSVAASAGTVWVIWFFGTGPTPWPWSDIISLCALAVPVGLVAASLGALPGALIGQIIRLVAGR